MSTDTPVQKDEPNASAEQQSAPVQPVSEEPVAPVTETAATDTDAQPSPAPETETVTPPQNRLPPNLPPFRRKKRFPRPKPPRYPSRPPRKPSRKHPASLPAVSTGSPPSAHWS